MVLEFSKLEFLVSIPLWRWLSWHLGIKKCHLVLELLKLEYCVSEVLELHKLEYGSGKIGESVQTHTQVYWTQVLC